VGPELDEAKGASRESVELFRKVGDRFMLAWGLYTEALASRDDLPYMRALLKEALEYFLETGDKSGYALVFDGFAALAHAEGDDDTALRLSGFAAATETLAGTGIAAINREFGGFYPEQLVATDAAHAAMYAAGQAMTLEEATKLALPDAG
jgi:hypothetical protein